MIRIIYLLLFILLIPISSVAIVNGSYQEATCVRKNTFLLADALVRYKGLDSLVSDYESNIRYIMTLYIDSIGNVEKIERIIKRNQTSGRRTQEFLSDYEIKRFQEFLNINKIRFCVCDSYDYDTGLSIKKSIDNTRKFFRERGDHYIIVNWPILSGSIEYPATSIISSHNIVRFASDLSKYDKRLLGEFKFRASKRNYNSGLMMLCLSYIVGDWEIMDWLDRDPFKIEMIVDRNGRPIKVLPSGNGATPIDSAVAGLMEDFFKSYNIRFKIPKGSMTVSAKHKRYQIAVDIPFTPQTIDLLKKSLPAKPGETELDLGPLYRLDLIYRLSQTFMDSLTK